MAASRILLVTEGTYPYRVGGVSSWCDLIVRGLAEYQWYVLPIVSSDAPRAPVLALPQNVTLAGRIELWSTLLPASGHRLRTVRRTADELPGILARELLAWKTSVEPLVDALVACRRDPLAVRTAFRSHRGWQSFLAGIATVLDEPVPHQPPAPHETFDVVEAARLYQTLYWIARTAAVPTPTVDAALVTAAGWSVVPALVHRAIHRTPVLLTEHGVYVREAYLDCVRRDELPARRFVLTRLARGLARAGYAIADEIATVTEANALWEQGLGVRDHQRVHVIHNGVELRATPSPPPRNGTVVSVGRIDPLKDVLTMLRVAAEVVERFPSARFLHYGPVTEGQEGYHAACLRLHRELGLGDRFQFRGTTADPRGAFRSGDIALLTSISEGQPLAALEAMSEARPVVATSVGGLPDAIRGCGAVAPPGRVHELAMAILVLLRDPRLAERLGQNGRRRVERRFAEGACVSHYRRLVDELVQAA